MMAAGDHNWSATERWSRSRPLNELPLTALLALARGGDDRALNVLLNRVERLVRSTIRYRVRRGPTAADDVLDATQEALVRIAEHVHTCRATSERTVVAWVRAIAEHAIADLARSPGTCSLAVKPFSSLERVLEVKNTGEAEGTEPLTLPAAIAVRAVCAAYASVPEVTATLLWHRLIAGESWAEIGRVIGTTASGAKRRYQRAQRALRQAALRWIDRLPEYERDQVLCWLQRHTTAKR